MLHEIEFGEHTTAQRNKLFRELKRVRQWRRLMKDENAALEPLYNLINKPEWDKIMIDLYKVRTSITRIMEGQENRQYKPKVRQDLTICEYPEETEEAV